jgi:hypothetical protein
VRLHVLKHIHTLGLGLSRSSMFSCSCALFYSRNIICALGEVIRLSGKQKRKLFLRMTTLKVTTTASDIGGSCPKKKKVSKKDRGGRDSGDGPPDSGGLKSLDHADQSLAR